VPVGLAVGAKVLVGTNVPVAVGLGNVGGVGLEIGPGVDVAVSVGNVVGDCVTVNDGIAVGDVGISESFAGGRHAEVIFVLEQRREIDLIAAIQNVQRVCAIQATDGVHPLGDQFWRAYRARKLAHE